MGYLTALAMLASAGIQAATRPDAPDTKTAAPASGGGAGRAENVFAVQTPGKTGAAPGAVTPDASFVPPNLLQTLLAGAPGSNAIPGMTPGAPVMNSQQPTPNPGQVPGMPGGQPGAPNTNKNTELLGAMAEGLAMAAPLLFGNEQRKSTQAVGAQGGGSGGQMVQGFNLPRRPSVSELLASLPRPKYG